MASEGRSAIEAAKKRLAAARSQKLAASKSLDSAKEVTRTARKNEENALSLFQSSQNEVEKAQAFLEEAENRWEVIDVVDSDGEGEKMIHKKRKAATATSSVAQQKYAKTANPTGPLTAANNFKNTERLIVEGAGTSEVNGTYERCHPYEFDPDRPADRNCPVYTKRGRWLGAPVLFGIWRDTPTSRWYISCKWEWCVIDYYRNPSRNEQTNRPPKTGWMTTHGDKPVPRLNW